MANLKEQDKWEDGVYQIEENDPVLGGENGITNKPIKQLANRTSWLKKALELLGKKSAPKDLTADSTSTTQDDGHTHALPSASTSAKGVVKLNSSTNSASETEAATPKAVKAALDKANQCVPYSSNIKNYATVVPNDDGYGGYEVAGGKNGNIFRIESAGDHFKFWSSVGNTPYAIHAPAKRNGTMALMDDVNTKVSKSGDAMNGILFIDGAAPGGFANGLVIRNKAGGPNTSGFVDFYQSDTVPRSSIWFRDAGNNSTQIEFLNTPEGANWNRDSREVALTLKSTGALWSKQYGWLHDHFAKQGDINNVWKELNNTYRKNRFRHQYYPNHYQGAEVYDIPVGDNGVMRIIIMRVTINGYAKVNLPEAFNGYCIVQATDVGGGQKRVGANIQNGNVVEIHNSGETGFNILAIGWNGW
ncbi:phage tail protein [Haemophilus parainfluenzae]|uniref:phage tail protein n=1 Tax=Haemophilus parainfluenzae TaxID=729 RepID=UPI00066DEC38|nr:phage tail protein [Haemophilus parainfluenzae]